MKNQIEFVVNELKTKGRISRNYCLANYISRLGAYIVKLKKSGWEFKTKTENGDYVYIVAKTPLDVKITNYTAPKNNTPQNSFLGLVCGDTARPLPTNNNKRWFDE